MKLNDHDEVVVDAIYGQHVGYADPIHNDYSPLHHGHPTRCHVHGALCPHPDRLFLALDHDHDHGLL